MPQITANGIPLHYEAHGPETGEPLLLIMGLGAQMTRWPAEFVAELAGRGYRVVQYDNRDVGLSHKFDEAGAPDMPEVYKALMSGQKPPVPYLVSDMAADGVGLMDALGFERAHIVGASMGGMIAQNLAAEHPGRVLSLTSIMSSTGNPALPPAKPEAMERLSNRGPDPRTDLEGFLDHGVSGARIMNGPNYQADEAELRASLKSDYERSFYPVGFARQMAAIVASGDRRATIAKITAPTVVVHGADDPLVPPTGGEDTHVTIPGSELHVLPAMGHNLPKPLIATLCDLIERATARARAEA
ncbi:alpha/beta fold hydrolase [Phenylobacterium sp.]|uniref:alpha/beta fold hydrolase n=1 Tax=Phenylobacterium sp. TaxID=1871053 RepID=UPI00273760D7|nr:alpha/beta hydrolase [Phenylobacterium sp.]MDP3854313.1 alpha/beta hydrolase [Phenylobacterium sp.]